MQGLAVSLPSAIVYVSGSVNGELLAWTLEGSCRWCTRVAPSPKGVYHIVLAAYDAAGNRSDYETRLDYGLHCKLDWRSADYLSAEELNRMGRNLITLRDLLVLHGCAPRMIIKTDWRAWDVPTRDDIDALRRAVDELQDCFCRMPDWREVVYDNTVDFAQVNAWEWDMETLNRWVERMVAAFCFSGDIFGGEFT